MPDRIHDLLRDHARQRPEAIAILQSGRTPLSYRQLYSQLQRATEAFRAAGVAEGERVAVVLPESAELAVAILAITLDAVCAPLNPAYTAGEFEAWFQAIRARALIVPKEAAFPAAAVAERLGMVVFDLISEPGEPAGVFSLDVRPPTINGRTMPELQSAVGAAVPPSDAALLLFTSATSARPKLVPLSHRNLSISARNIADATQLTSSDRCLGVMPLFHIHGLSTLFATLVSGGSCPAPSGFSGERFLASMAEFLPTWYSASPAIHRAVLDQLRRQPAVGQPTSLRFVRSASAPMPRQLLEDIERTLGVPLLEAYGMTEAGPQIASNRLPPAARKPGSVGRPAGPDVAIMNAAGAILPAGTTGEIVIRGENVTSGYENDPAANNAAFVNGWLRSGDLGYLDADGFLFVTGRIKEVINRGGEKVSPGVIERVLLQHPAVAQAVVFGIPDPALGESIAAAVVLTPETGTPDKMPRQIRQFVASRLAQFEVPRLVVVVDQIPLGPTGKLNRGDLAKALKLIGTDGWPPEAKSDQPPRTAAERRIADAFADVLVRGPVGIQDDFFELGGNSLSATQVVVRLGKVFQVDLPPECLFERPTVVGLAALIGERMANLVAGGTATLEWQQPREPSSHPVDVIVPQAGTSPAPLSFAQQQAFFVDQMGAGNAYNMDAPLWLTGPLDIAVLARSLEEIRLRHEILRSTFRLNGGEAVQLVIPHSPSDLRLVDITATPAAEREAAALRLANEESSKPFDLGVGPPFRATLFRLAADEHLLVLCIHHIAADGWSVGVLHRELASLYAAIRDGGHPAALSPLQIQYGDFAIWQRRRLAEGAYVSKLAYWSDRLKDVAPTCTFPADRPRPSMQSYRGQTVNRSIHRPIVERLRELSQRQNATLFMTCLTVLKVMLRGHNGQDDCVVGVPIANRTRPELEPLIGFFANTLALRTDLSGDPTFDDLLGRVRDTALGAYANQDVPLEMVVDALHLPRNPGHTPIFQVMFAFQNLPGSTADRDGQFDLGSRLVARPFQLETRGAKFDLTLYLTESADGITMTWLYNTDLYDRSSVERYAERYQAMLGVVAADHHRRIAEIPLSTDSERQRVIVEWNPLGTPFGVPVDFMQLFDGHVRRTPDATAVACQDTALTYEELNRRANRIAAYLERVGVSRGALVGVCLRRSVNAVAAMLAVWKTGAAVLPLDPSYPQDRLAFMLQDARATLLLTEAGLLPPMRLSSTTLCLDTAEPEIAQESSDDVLREHSPENPTYVIYTSGSSGRPKGVVISRGNLSHYCRSLSTALGIRADDRYLHTASFAFSSSMRQLLVPLTSGATVVVATTETTRDPEHTLRDHRPRRRHRHRHRAVVLGKLPSGAQGDGFGVQSTLAQNALRLLLSASEPLSTALVLQWRQLLGHPTSLVNLYGQTETTGIATIYPIPPELDPSRAIVPIGRPIGGTRAYVLDTAGRPTPIGVRGELHIGGVCVGQGYLNQDDLTAAHFTQDPFGQPPARLYRTGDIARFIDDGTIEIAGRADEQIKVRGFRIEPAEVEAVIREYPGVRECLVVPLEDRAATFDESRRLAAFVTPGWNGSPTETAEAALREFLKRELPEYMLPKRIVAVDRLPRTPNGKIDRVALRSHLPFEAQAPSSVSHGHPTIAVPLTPPRAPRTPPRTALEQSLADVWKAVLKIEQVYVDENFFDLGGNSLACISVVVQARQRGLGVSLQQLYQHQTIAELGEVVAAGNSAAIASSVVTDATEPRLDATKRAADPGYLITLNSLRDYGREALTRAGLNAVGAQVVTEVQLEASLRGQVTHHVVSIPRYARRLLSGRINASPQIRVEHETDNSARVDGDNGPGQWVSTFAMDVAIRKARQAGIGMVAVRRSNHFGAAGQYVWQATREGLIGLCTTNGPLILAPTGGVTPTFGNNPLGVGIPSARHAPILVDIAMSVATRGKIGLQVAEGKPLLPGWILDKLGRASTDLADLAAGLGVPIGGHKGYGLALVMEILAGALSGAGVCSDHEREKLHRPGHVPDFGHLFVAIDPARFMPTGDFLERVDRIIDQIKAGPRTPGVDEIFIPGEMEMRARERNLRDGVPVSPATYNALTTYARDMGLASRLDIISAPRELSLAL